MPRPIYSVNFFTGALNFGGSPVTQSYTVPAGNTAVVRSWTIGKTATPAARAYLLVGPATPQLIDVIDLPVVAISASVREFSHVVAPAGSIIRAQAIAGSTWVTCSGYLLTNF